MNGFITNLQATVNANQNFRRVLHTSLHSQLVIMMLKPSQEIGLEVHEVDQFIYIEKGHGTVILDGDESPLEPGSGVVIPAGTEHNVVNGKKSAMHLFTVYAPAEHPDGIVEATKAEAERLEE